MSLFSDYKHIKVTLSDLRLDHWIFVNAYQLSEPEEFEPDELFSSETISESIMKCLDEFIERNGDKFDSIEEAKLIFNSIRFSLEEQAFIVFNCYEQMTCFHGTYQFLTEEEFELQASSYSFRKNGVIQN